VRWRIIPLLEEDDTPEIYFAKFADEEHPVYAEDGQDE
jgi:hypothetical protein